MEKGRLIDIKIGEPISQKLLKSLKALQSFILGDSPEIVEAAKRELMEEHGYTEERIARLKLLYKNETTG